MRVRWHIRDKLQYNLSSPPYPPRLLVKFRGSRARFWYGVWVRECGIWWVYESIVLPYNDGRLLARIKESVEGLQATFVDEHPRLRAKGKRKEAEHVLEAPATLAFPVPSILPSNQSVRGLVLVSEYCIKKMELKATIVEALKVRTKACHYKRQYS
ncbi:hypothetical protein GALMADRAFT_215961 [Galerina marginata CBS 339.88]|uniref:Uncharacterized protein n=1 Tax=Galerina marginata (strain CBS 339.88) TaxID=685588 RepID=A0A067SE83_GALM3|nr:hypothetical protein GALMADRAFT_215961 [Galerina marginata CBS 339.88]